MQEKYNKNLENISATPKVKLEVLEKNSEKGP